MTRRGNNSLISIGGNSRGRGRRHASGMDLVTEGMKYGAAFGIAHEGFKAWSNHNNNNQQPQQMMQPMPRYVQQPMQMQQQQQQREPSPSPPPYSEKAPQNVTSTAHRTFCNGQCGGRCMATTTGSAATYYNGSNL